MSARMTSRGTRARKKTVMGNGLPSYMEGVAGKGLENLGPEDFAWIGEDGNLPADEEERYLKSLFNPEAALEEIAIKIIRDHPNNETTGFRLKNAMRALLGRRS